MSNGAAPDSPTSARLSASELADLIDRFVRDGGDYFGWANIVRLSVPPIPDLTKHDADPRKDAFGQCVKAALDSPGGRESDALARGVEAQGNHHEYRARLLKNGPLLATALEGRGADTTGLLRFLYAIDRGGGAETAGPLWPKLKVNLLRVSIQLRHSNESGKAASTRWVWDLRPLRRGTWGNLEQPDDGTSAGQTVKACRAVGMLNGTHQIVPLLPGQAKPSMGMGLQSRPYYIPTDEDTALVERLFPKLTDPSNPPWPQIEARLIVAGQVRDKLAAMNAPTLLLLLAGTCGGGNAGTAEQSAESVGGKPAAPDGDKSPPKNPPPPNLKADSGPPESQVEKAKAAYDWAIKNVPNAENMTVAEILKEVLESFDALIANSEGQEREKLQNFRNDLPDNPDTFGRYLLRAGVKRYDKTGHRRASRNVQHRGQI